MNKRPDPLPNSSEGVPIIHWMPIEIKTIIFVIVGIILGYLFRMFV